MGLIYYKIFKFKLQLSLTSFLTADRVAISTSVWFFFSSWLVKSWNSWLWQPIKSGVGYTRTTGSVKLQFWFLMSSPLLIISSPKSITSMNTMSLDHFYVQNKYTKMNQNPKMHYLPSAIPQLINPCQNVDRHVERLRHLMRTGAVRDDNGWLEQECNILHRYYTAMCDEAEE